MPHCGLKFQTLALFRCRGTTPTAQQHPPGSRATLVFLFNICLGRFFFFFFPSYISLDVAEDEQGRRVVRVVFNGKEKVLPGAEGAWIPLAALQER